MMRTGCCSAAGPRPARAPRVRRSRAKQAGIDHVGRPMLSSVPPRPNGLQSIVERWSCSAVLSWHRRAQAPNQSARSPIYRRSIPTNALSVVTTPEGRECRSTRLVYSNEPRPLEIQPSWTRRAPTRRAMGIAVGTDSHRPCRWSLGRAPSPEHASSVRAWPASFPDGQLRQHPLCRWTVRAGGGAPGDMRLG